MKHGCGSCNLCCKLLHVPDIGKPAQMTCWWTTVHGGCIRQADKQADPDLAACAQFKCLWLASQDSDDEEMRQSRFMRPDQTHVVFGPQDRDDETLLYVQVDPAHSTAWQKPAVVGYINGIVERGGRVEIIVGDAPRIEITEPI